MKDKKAPDWEDKSLIEIVSNSVHFLLKNNIINTEEFGVIWDRVNSWIDYHILGSDGKNLNDFAKRKPPSEDNVKYFWTDHSLEFRLEQILQTLGWMGFVTDEEFSVISERTRPLKTNHENEPIMDMELNVFSLLESDNTDVLREAAAQAFQAAMALPLPDNPQQRAYELVRIGCLGVLGDRNPDVRRLFSTFDSESLHHNTANWGEEVKATVLDIWIKLLRRQDSKDLDGVQQGVAKLRAKQREREPDYLKEAERRKDARPAWELMSLYHLAKAAEILGMYLIQGSVEGRCDVRQKLQAQFDHAIKTAAKGQSMELETFARLLARTARNIDTEKNID